MGGNKFRERERVSDSISPTALLAKFPGSELVPNPHRFLTPEGPGAATTTPALECASGVCHTEVRPQEGV